MPRRVAAVLMAGWEGKAIAAWRFWGRPAIASGLGAQMDVSAQLGNTDSAGATMP
jgi:hypothetical protein